MKWFDIFKNYNLKLFRENKASCIFIIISVTLAVCISLAIPQVVLGLEQFGENESKEMNGADLKIEAPYKSEKFSEKIEELKGKSEVKEVQIYNSTVEKNSTQMYSELLAGDYELSTDEAIISQNIADTLKAAIGDSIKLAGKEYRITAIENRVRGVSGQAEKMGYAKISPVQTISEYSSGKLYLMNDKNYVQIKEELKEIESNYTYTTVADVRADLEQQTQTEAMSLNILNTLSFIMAVLSVMSSIFLIISKCRQDISILKLISVKEKDIGRSFKAQFLCLILPSVLLGAGSSIFAAKILLLSNHIDYSFHIDAGLKLLGGILLFSFIYIVYIHISCRLLRQINPLSILKAGESKLKGGRIIFFGICFTVLASVSYASYVGADNIFSGSLMIMIILALFFLLIFFVIKIFTTIKFGKVLNRYFVAHIKEKRFSFALTVMSLSFTILFFLVGFTLGKTIAASYSENIDSKINYNYMLTAKNQENIESILLQSENTGFYTKLNLNYGLLYLNGVSEQQVILDGIEADKYGVTYPLLEGKDLFKGSSKEVLISQEMAQKYELGISDEIEIKSETAEKKYKIKGIYESGGMNQNHILIQNTGLKNENAGIMYLASIHSADLIPQLKEVQIVNLENVSNALETSIQNFLNIFKTLCIICIVTSIVFNINIVYMNYLADYKNFIIMRAVGLGKKVLYKNVFAEALAILLLTLLMSAGLYIMLVNLAVKLMFDTKLAFNIGIVIIPTVIALMILVIVFIIPVRMVQKSNQFEELRELV